MYLIVKRILDFLFSIIGIIFLIPLYLIIRLAYILTGDFHRIFYTQDRVGKNGKIFKMYKFRTMCIDAEKKLEEMLKKEKYKKEWDEFHKIENDPRITKVGRFLRRGSLDEIPQFLNVLIGQLSFVGPRPLVPGELEAHHGNKKLYWSVKPGITGWWAVNGRSLKNYKDRLTLEYFYIENCSLSLDIKIFLKTIFCVFKKTGAK